MSGAAGSARASDALRCPLSTRVASSAGIGSPSRILLPMGPHRYRRPVSSDSSLLLAPLGVRSAMIPGRPDGSHNRKGHASSLVLDPPARNARLNPIFEPTGSQHLRVARCLELQMVASLCKRLHPLPGARRACRQRDRRRRARADSYSGDTRRPWHGRYRASVRRIRRTSKRRRGKCRRRVRDRKNLHIIRSCEASQPVVIIHACVHKSLTTEA